MLRRLSLDIIEPNRDQPRKAFNASALDDLARSIENNGLMQPITVRPLGDGRYQIVAGERRYRAHKLLTERGVGGFATILAHIRKMDDGQRDIEAIIENLARADITPLEEARAYKRMVDAGWEPDALGKKLGMRQPWRVKEKLRLLDLEPTLLKLYETGNLSKEAAYEICRLPNARDQLKIAKLVSSGALKSWQAITAAVNAVLDEKTQADIFGDAAPRASDEDIKTVNRMEAKIEQMATMAATGWKDGECLVASKVSPDRARVMAEKLKAMQKALAIMERDLRTAAAQAEVVRHQVA